MSNLPAVALAMERMFGHPAIGDDMGFNPLIPRPHFRHRVHVPISPWGGGGGYGDPSDDVGDIEGDDARISQMGADACGDDVGAHGHHTVNHIQRMQQELAQKEAALRMAVPGTRRARKLEHQVAHLRQNIANAQRHLHNKLAHQVSHGRITPGEAAALAAAGGVAGGAAMAYGGAPGGAPAGMYGNQYNPGQGYPSSYTQAPQFTGAAIPESMKNRVDRSPPAGEEIRIPLLISGSPILLVTVGVGAGLRSTPIAAVSPGIAYAGFQLVGIDVDMNIAYGQNAAGFQNQNILVNLLVNSLNVSGNKNTLYAAQAATFAGQEFGRTGGKRTIAGLRENQVVQPTNTIECSATFRQEISNDVAFNATVQLAAVLRAIYDPAAGVGPR